MPHGPAAGTAGVSREGKADEETPAQAEGRVEGAGGAGEAPPNCTCGSCMEGWLSARMGRHLGLAARSARWDGKM